MNVYFDSLQINDENYIKPEEHVSQGINIGGNKLFEIVVLVGSSSFKGSSSGVSPSFIITIASENTTFIFSANNFDTFIFDDNAL